MVGITVMSVGISLMALLSRSVTTTVTNTYEQTWRTPYDILVHMPSAEGNPLPDIFEPNVLTSFPPGITQRQVKLIRQIPGVQVAAPVAVAGVVLSGVNVAFPSAQLPHPEGGLYQVTAQLKTEQAAIPESITWKQVVAFPVNAQGELPANTPYGAIHIDNKPLTGIRIPTKVPLLLVGIDPSAEKQLAGLDRAYIQGRELDPDETVAKGQIGVLERGSNEPKFYPRVPVLLNVDSFRGLSYDIRIEALNENLQVVRLVQEVTWSEQELSQLIRSSDSPTSILIGNGGPLAYERVESPYPDKWPVALSLSATQTDPLHLLANLGKFSTELGYSVRDWSPSQSPIELQVVGLLDSGKMKAGPSEAGQLPVMTYEPARASHVLDGSARPVNPPRRVAGGISPVSFLSSPPALVTTIPAVLALAGDHSITAIQVKVQDTERLTPITISRVQSIAEEIERSTGLATEVITGSSPVNVLIQVLGSGGKPDLGWIESTWVHKNAATTAVQQTEIGYSVFAGMLLANGLIYAIATGLAGVAARRREFGIMTALGWPDSALRHLVIGEQVVFAALGGCLAFAASITGGASWREAGMALLVALLLYLPAIAAAAYSASSISAGEALQWGSTSPGRRLLAGSGSLQLALANLFGRARQTIMTVVALSMPTGFLLVAVHISRNLNGLLYTSIVGKYAALNIGPLQYITGLVALAFAVLTAYELIRQNAKDHRHERVLLRALGWPNHRIALLMVLEGGILGALAGVLGDVLGLAILSSLYGPSPVHVWQDAAAAWAIPFVIGLLAGILGALSEPRSWTGHMPQRQRRTVPVQTSKALLGMGLLLLIVAPLSVPLVVRNQDSKRPGSEVTLNQTLAAAEIEAAVAQQNQALQALKPEIYLATMDSSDQNHLAQTRHWLEDVRQWRLADPANLLLRTVADVRFIDPKTARVKIRLAFTGSLSTEAVLDTVWVRTGDGVWLEHGSYHQEASSGDITVEYPEGTSPIAVSAALTNASEIAISLEKALGTQLEKPLVIELFEDHNLLKATIGPTHMAHTDVQAWGAFGENLRLAAAAVLDRPSLRQGLTRKVIVDQSGDRAPDWLRDGLADHLLVKSGLANSQKALMLLAPLGPVRLDRLPNLAPGGAEYERAVATVSLMAAYLEEERGPFAARHWLGYLGQHREDLSETVPTEYAKSRLALAALQTVAGTSLTDFEQSFLAWLRNRAIAVTSALEDYAPSMVSPSSPAPPVPTAYIIDLKAEPSSKNVEGGQHVIYTNNSSVPLESIYFHLYPNAPHFKGLKVVSNGTPGLLAVHHVEADGVPVTPVLLNGAELMAVPLPVPLAPGKSVKVHLEWSATVPDLEGRLGSDDKTLYLGNIYPILAIRDSEGWHLDQYVSVGDPFFSEVANYDVTFTVPAQYLVAATGRLESRAEDGNSARFRFTAERVRDFASAVGANWRLYEEEVEGIRVHYYRRTSGTQSAGGEVLAPEAALSVIRGALLFYEDKWGNYPYQDITVVDHQGIASEYPQFVISPPQAAALAHEIAHQWWYAVIGGDQLRQIWDEGLAEFSAMYYLSTYGLPMAADHSQAGSETDCLCKTLYQYALDLEEKGVSYAGTVYGRGWRLWQAVRSSMGDETFTRMLRDVYARNQFGVLTWSDWRHAVLQAGGEKSVEVFDKYVYGGILPVNEPTHVTPDEEE